MSAATKLLRSVIHDPRLRTPELQLVNLRALLDSEMVFDNVEDHRILDCTAAFVAEHGHIPSISTLSSLLPDDDCRDRLERVLMERTAIVRGDFECELHDYLRARRSHALVEDAKTAVAIAVGVVEVDGRRLRGPDDAARYLASRLPTDDADWPDPMPLGSVSTDDLPAAPVDALPPVMRALVAAVAMESQVDPAMPMAFAIGAAAACAQRAYYVQVRDGWREPLAHDAATIAGPAERKSGAMGSVFAPVYDWELAATSRWAEVHKQWTADAAVLGARRKSAKGADLCAVELELADHATKEPVEPRVLTSDATQERLVMLAASQGESITVCSAEGAGPFALAAGRYSAAKVPSYEHLLAGHAGDAIAVDRVGRPSLRLRNPSISVVVACQLEALRTLTSIPGARGLGLLARFIYVFPRSRVGSRDTRAPAIPASVREAWASTLTKILDASRGLSARIPLRFDAPALDSLLAFADNVEPRLGPDGDLRAIADWAGKLVGQVARIAGLFAVVVGATTVSADCVRRAVALAPWLIAHARAAFGAGVADPTSVAAAEILDWLRAHPVQQPTKRDLHRHLQGRPWITRIGDLDAPLGRLVDHGWIKIRPAPRAGRGRPGSPTVVPRPDLRARMTAPTAVIEPPANTPPIKIYDHILTYDDVDETFG